MVGPNAYDEGADAGLIPGWDGERRDDMVVTTKATMKDGKELDEMENQPRGFFADQVRVPFNVSLCTCLL